MRSWNSLFVRILINHLTCYIVFMSFTCILYLFGKCNYFLRSILETWLFVELILFIAVKSLLDFPCDCMTKYVSEMCFHIYLDPTMTSIPLRAKCFKNTYIGNLYICLFPTMIFAAAWSLLIIMSRERKYRNKHKTNLMK